VLEATVWDWDRFSSPDYMGCFEVPQPNPDTGPVIKEEYKLVKGREKCDDTITGSVHVTVIDEALVGEESPLPKGVVVCGRPVLAWDQMDPEDEPVYPEDVVVITIGSGRGLKGKDINGLSDPYISVRLPNGNEELTAVHYECLDPDLNESFYIKKSVWPKDSQIKIEMWDHDEEENKGNDFLGRIVLDRPLCHVTQGTFLLTTVGRKGHVQGTVEVKVVDHDLKGYEEKDRLRWEQQQLERERVETGARQRLERQQTRKVGASVAKQEEAQRADHNKAKEKKASQLKRAQSKRQIEEGQKKREEKQQWQEEVVRIRKAAADTRERDTAALHSREAQARKTARQKVKGSAFAFRPLSEESLQSPPTVAAITPGKKKVKPRVDTVTATMTPRRRGQAGDGTWPVPSPTKSPARAASLGIKSPRRTPRGLEGKHTPVSSSRQKGEDVSARTHVNSVDLKLPAPSYLSLSEEEERLVIKARLARMMQGQGQGQGQDQGQGLVTDGELATQSQALFPSRAPEDTLAAYIKEQKHGVRTFKRSTSTPAQAQGLAPVPLLLPIDDTRSHIAEAAEEEGVEETPHSANSREGTADSRDEKTVDSNLQTVNSRWQTADIKEEATDSRELIADIGEKAVDLLFSPRHALDRTGAAVQKADSRRQIEERGSPVTRVTSVSSPSTWKAVTANTGEAFTPIRELQRSEILSPFSPVVEAPDDEAEQQRKALANLKRKIKDQVQGLWKSPSRGPLSAPSTPQLRALHDLPLLLQSLTSAEDLDAVLSAAVAMESGLDSAILARSSHIRKPSTGKHSAFTSAPRSRPESVRRVDRSQDGFVITVLE
jgi:hypothetical protein